VAGFTSEYLAGINRNPQWKTHAGALEAEMLKRGMFFQIIDWLEDQGTRPLGA
jgi:hypothetical protein